YLGLDELPDLKYMEALRLVLQEFAEQLRAEYPSEVLLVESLLERFPNDLPALWMSRLRAQKCA
ncbi:MAG: transposase, partial [Dialister sp.]|nr:transposase [Dialister sp.]